MKHIIKRHTISFKHAFEGLSWSLKTQPNYQIHFVLSIAAILGGIILKISHIEFVIVLTLITLGLVIETINTSIEQTTDAIDRKIREDIKIAKDASAAAMLIFAAGSTIIAGIVFVPKIMQLFGV